MSTIRRKQPGISTGNTLDQLDELLVSVKCDSSCELLAFRGLLADYITAGRIAPVDNLKRIVDSFIYGYGLGKKTHEPTKSSVIEALSHFASYVLQNYEPTTETKLSFPLYFFLFGYFNCHIKLKPKAKDIDPKIKDKGILDYAFDCALPIEFVVNKHSCGGNSASYSNNKREIDKLIAINDIGILFILDYSNSPLIDDLSYQWEIYEEIILKKKTHLKGEIVILYFYKTGNRAPKTNVIKKCFVAEK